MPVMNILQITLFKVNIWFVYLFIYFACRQPKEPQNVQKWMNS